MNNSTLIYGFGQFGDIQTNTSSALIERLRQSTNTSAILFRVFDVSYAGVKRDMTKLFEKYPLQLAIGFGVAEGEHAVRLEFFHITPLPLR